MPDAAPAMRSLTRQVFLDTLSEISIAKAFERHVEYSRGVLRVREDLYDPRSFASVTVIAFGKAAHSMTEALQAQMGPQSGVICAPTPAATQLSGFAYYVGGHPLPNAESIKAARAILRTLEKRKENDLVIFLLSGGGSSLVEAPCDAEISLDDLIATYQALVHCGAPIAEINAIRKHLSAIKGGHLARAAYPAQQVSIMVSDVPEKSLDALASGPTMPDSTTEADCYRVAGQYDLLPRLPASVRELLQKEFLEETPKADDHAFVRARWWPILSSADAERIAADALRKQGFQVEIDHSCDDWDYTRAAEYLLERLRQLQKSGGRTAIVCGGEVTVQVAESAGRGGRNQQFALHCAEKITGEDICVLSAGTDGIDGNSAAAGAIVDGTTLVRAKEKGLEARKSLERFDAAPVFEALGDAVVTGATGNNVRDLRILLAY